MVLLIQSLEGKQGLSLPQTHPSSFGTEVAAARDLKSQRNEIHLHFSLLFSQGKGTFPGPARAWASSGSLCGVALLIHVVLKLKLSHPKSRH